jgi:hypothetical protein
MKYAAAGAAFLLLLVIAFIAAATSMLAGPTGLGDTTCLTPMTSSTLEGGPASGAPISHGFGGSLTEEQRGNAALIIHTAHERDLPARAAVIAVAVALQESRLRNLDHGDRDSLGLFQQRPSQGWGTRQQVLAPAHAARQFYGRLTGVSRWERLPLTQAAQAVQRSAYPDAYAQWEPLAQHLVDALTGACVLPIAGEQAAAVLAYAHAQLGKPYLWGAEGPQAFDCSGLTMRAYQAAGIPIPRVAADQWRHGLPVPTGQEQPGDLAFFNMKASGPGHVGIVLGGGQMIHAPNRRDVVRIASYQRPDLVGFTRPPAEEGGFALQGGGSL